MNINEKKIEKDFDRSGFIKFKLDKKIIYKLKIQLIQKIKKETGLKKINLENFHKQVSINELNDLRLKLYNLINEDQSFEKNLFKSAQKFIEKMVGSEMCKGSINLSIQYPKDETSVLPMHTDFFSGESIFQVNLWVPFVNVRKTNSMFIINPQKSIEILKKIKNSKKILFRNINKNYINYIKFINLNFGQGILFSPNCLHGNLINKENTTRWSINIRYKNIFSPYNNIFENEKKIYSFYKLFTPKIITKFNLKYDFINIVQ
jgi:sporadic carbohydrate cluster 2OG-Fe(II) oxygenase